MTARDGQGGRSNSPQRSGGGRRRSRRGRGAGGGSGGGKRGQNTQQVPGNRSQGGRGRKRRKPSHGGTGFWGDPAKLPTSQADIRITDEPAAVPRSLGPPPLPGHEQIAVHYFTAVYDRAVATAGALAAAGGLIDPNALAGEDGSGTG
jgi:hypothetical protein